MSTKSATPKTTAPQVKTAAVVRKPATEKAPVRAVVPTTPNAASEQKMKAKKTKQPDSKKKRVRDSFSMPQSDYAKIGKLKQLCLKVGVQVKKNQLLRAGLHALEKLSTAQLKTALSSLEKASAKETV